MKHVPIGRERIPIRDIEKYITKNGELSEERKRLIVSQWHKKCWKRQLNDPFTPEVKKLMASLGFEQDHEDGWKVKSGSAKNALKNSGIMAESELKAAKDKIATLDKEVIQLQKKLDLANRGKDHAKAKEAEATTKLEIVKKERGSNKK